MLAGMSHRMFVEWMACYQKPQQPKEDVEGQLKRVFGRPQS